MQSNPLFSTIYWPPKFQPVIGCVQIVHDLAEHQGRYDDIGELFSSHGYVVITSDLKGHGTNIKRESDLGYLGNYNLNNPVGHIHEISVYIKNKFPDVPYLLIGHGLGALICTSYLKKYDYFIDELLLSCPIPPKSTKLNRLLCNGLMAAKGEYYRSVFMNKRIYGVRNRDNADIWLSNDVDVLNEYSHDRKCGFTYTLNGSMTILNIIDDAYVNGSWIRKNLHLPVRIVCGENDPVSGHKIKKIKNMFVDKEYDNVHIETLPLLMHDLYNGNHSDATKEYILKELDRLQLQ